MSDAASDNAKEMRWDYRQKMVRLDLEHFLAEPSHEFGKNIVQDAKTAAMYARDSREGEAFVREVKEKVVNALGYQMFMDKW